MRRRLVAPLRPGMGVQSWESPSFPRKRQPQAEGGEDVKGSWQANIDVLSVDAPNGQGGLTTGGGFGGTCQPGVHTK